jgi:hypothetical protein
MRSIRPLLKWLLLLALLGAALARFLGAALAGAYS